MTQILENHTFTLKKCPFCGQEPKMLEYFEDMQEGTRYYVICGNPQCHIVVHTIKYHTPEQAVREWNKQREESK